MEVFPGTPNTFEFSSATGELLFKREGLGSTEQDMFYTIIITLNDGELILGQSTYKINFFVPRIISEVKEIAEEVEEIVAEVVEENSFAGVIVVEEEIVVDETIEPPFFKQMTVNNEGKVFVYFSELFVVPSNITAVNETVLDVVIIPSGAVLDEFLYYTWNITDFKNDYLELQLFFERPLYISS